MGRQTQPLRNLDGGSFAFKEPSIGLRMDALLLLLLHLLPFCHPAPDPDTNLHLHLPPEGGQGGQPNTGAGFAADSPSRLCQPCESTCLGNLFCCPVQKKCIAKDGQKCPLARDYLNNSPLVPRLLA